MRPWRHRILAPFLGIWVGAILFSAWPDALLASDLVPHRRRLHRLLKVNGVLGGLPVFTDTNRARPVRVIRTCVQVLGIDSGGDPVALYSTWPDCRVPRIRIAENLFDRAIIRVFRRARGRAARSQSSLSDAPELKRLAAYFCARSGGSEQFPGGVVLVLVQTGFRLATNQAQSVAEVVHFMDCGTGRSQPLEWPTVDLTDEYGPQLSWSHN